MDYKDSFVPNTVIKSADINKKYEAVQNNTVNGAKAMWVIGEVISDGTLTGATFYTAHPSVPASIMVYVDGIRLTVGVDCLTTNNPTNTTIVLTVPLILTQTMIVDYIRKDI